MMRFSSVCIALALSAVAGACSHVPSVSGVLAATSGRSASERVTLALDLLERGEQNRAEAELDRALAEEPGNVSAQRLLEQINTDPQELLGARNRPHTVRAGETMSTLAQNFLGDPLLFYALSRYNDMEAPNQLAVGQVVRIPNRPRSASAARRPPTTQTSTPQVAVVPIPPAAQSGANPGRANQLRLQALEQMNTGAVDRAVSLLRQAQTLDASNAAIQRDLGRALRIQASLRTPG